jgi:hypothetical protein
MALLNLSVTYQTISKTLLLLFFPLVSIYVLPSGGFQLVDISIVLIILFTLATVSGSELKPMAPAFITLAAYIAWLVLNSFAYFLVRSDLFYIKVIVQNVFAATIFISFTVLFQRVVRRQDTIKFVVFALLLSVIPVFFVRGATDLSSTDFNIFGGRGALSFNNPNQLGYYSVLILSILVVMWIYCPLTALTKRQKIGVSFASFLVFSASHFFAIYSASRAAVVAIALLDLLIMIRLRRLFIQLSAVMITLLIIFLLSPFGQAITNSRLVNAVFITRFTQSSVESNASHRTLGLFFENLPSEASVLLGGGKTIMRAGIREVHNALFDILLSYGILGLVLFVAFLVALALEPMRRRIGFKRWVYLYAVGPTLAYNMFHNGFRVRLMWVFLALWYVLVIYTETDNGANEGQVPEAATLSSWHQR